MGHIGGLEKWECVSLEVLIKVFEYWFGVGHVDCARGRWKSVFFMVVI